MKPPRGIYLACLGHEGHHSHLDGCDGTRNSCCMQQRTKSNAATNLVHLKNRRGGINPITGLTEPYVGMMKNGRLQYKRSIADPLGLEGFNDNFEKRSEASAPRRRTNPNKKKKVYPRNGKRRDPGGFIHEERVRSFWVNRLHDFQDFTKDGSDAIGADFRGFDAALQKTVYVEAQPMLHDLTPNEHRGVVNAAAEGALYVIHTRKTWDYFTPSDFDEVKAFRLNRRFA